MKYFNFLLICLTLFLVFSCSGQKTSEKESNSDQKSMEGSDDQELFGEDGVKDGKELPGGQAINEAEKNLQEHITQGDGTYSYYEVEQNDTLMWIAFKIYGDCFKWRDIVKENDEFFKDKAYVLEKGTKLKFIPPTKSFEWNPAGDPYLILRGDTLGKISKKVYQTPQKWKDIWKNNKKMITNPNIIYAGFTLFYKPLHTLAHQDS